MLPSCKEKRANRDFVAAANRNSGRIWWHLAQRVDLQRYQRWFANIWKHCASSVEQQDTKRPGYNPKQCAQYQWGQLWPLGL